MRTMVLVVLVIGLIVVAGGLYVTLGDVEFPQKQPAVKTTQYRNDERDISNDILRGSSAQEVTEAEKSLPDMPEVKVEEVKKEIDKEEITASSKTQDKALRIDETSTEVIISNDTVLATINEELIRVQDLAGVIGTNVSGSRKVSQNRLKYFLDEEINRRLVSREAQSQGIKLDEEEKETLAERREGRRYDEAVVDPIGDEKSLAEQELREASAQLLELKLLETQGILPPYVTEEQVEVRYRETMETYGPLPNEPEERARAWQIINLRIRQELTPIIQAQYEERRTEYLNQLRESSNVQVNLYGD